MRAPDAEEWRRFLQTLELRDVGTHLCALPAGEHCSRPKKSATPIFKRMLTSHQAALQRITSALRRAGDLDDDVAAAIEAA